MIKNLFRKFTGYYPDKEISNWNLIFFCFSKFISLLRGFFCFFRMDCFKGKNSSIRCKNKVIFGKWLNIAENVHMNALSHKGIEFGTSVSIGRNSRIECTGSFATLGVGFKCGDYCGLGTDCFYGAAGGIEIGNNVIIGNYVSMHSENHNFERLDIPIRLQGVNHKGIIIGNDCWIGAKVTVLDGAKIGSGTVIAAGSVVRGEFPDNVVIAGVPARIIKYR